MKAILLGAALAALAILPAGAQGWGHEQHGGWQHPGWHNSWGEGGFGGGDRGECWQIGNPWRREECRRDRERRWGNGWGH